MLCVSSTIEILPSGFNRVTINHHNIMYENVMDSIVQDKDIINESVLLFLF